MTFLQLSEGYPDGICVDSNGDLWVAVWGLGEVRQYDHDGQLATVVETSAPNTSSVAFVGPDRATLAITTARTDLTSTELAESPDSGAVFLADVDAYGVADCRWQGIEPQIDVPEPTLDAGWS